MPKKIVIFADGTGNAFSTQESNVWRLYRALDQAKPNQIAYYIKGVGTAGFRPIAMLDGATGLGVPENVRKLYRFLCWSWQPGDEIYAFGFSRGAFTIRTLIGLIMREGLLPTAINGRPVTSAEMKRNSKAAWRHYRAESSSKDILPTIWLTRKIRDGLLAIPRLLRRDRRGYDGIRAEVKAQQRDRIPIKFLGLFDTVEAFGVPIEEVRGAIDWAIWPISFRERRLNELVENARHALSLDDERTTFHPIRWDQTREILPNTRIKEVWFAGVHSDVGGGYPDNALEYVPLVWMAQEAELATTDAAGHRTVNGLCFVPGALDEFRRRASPFGTTHDSRAGTGSFYRYSPRLIEPNIANGGVPIIHHSVAEKMAFGSDRYAPVVISGTPLVWMPDGTTVPIGAPTAVFPPTPEYQAAADAMAELRTPDSNLFDLTRDTIWWRRVSYFALLLSSIAVAILPKTAEWITSLCKAIAACLSSAVGLGGHWDGFWNSLIEYQRGVARVLQNIGRLLEGIVPSYGKPWIDIIVVRPGASALIIGLFVAAFLWNGRLKEKIVDRANLAWFAGKRAEREKSGEPLVRESVWLCLARRSRNSSAGKRVAAAFSGVVVPTVFLAALLVVVVVTLSRNTATFLATQERKTAGYTDGFCMGSKPEAETIADGETVTIATPFRPSELCWASGRMLERGRVYTLQIDEIEPFFDRTLVADIAGFKGTWLQTLAQPIRRWWTAEWFQPIARIGAKGGNEWPLVALDGSALRTRWFERKKDEDRPGGERKELSPHVAVDARGTMGICSPIPDDEWADAQEQHRRYDVKRRFISQFTARTDGELFLYVNDAILAMPLLPPVRCWYNNNRGAAKVSIRKEPLPDLKAKKAEPQAAR